MKKYVDLTDDSIYFKEIVQDGVEMFRFFYDQVKFKISLNVHWLISYKIWLEMKSSAFFSYSVIL